MSVLLPELTSVRLRETAEELVVEVEVPEEVDICRLSALLVDGLLEIRLPRVPRRPDRILGFHPDASGV
jgi:HSP20 family molecular chaperone IbpA